MSIKSLAYLSQFVPLTGIALFASATVAAEPPAAAPASSYAALAWAPGYMNYAISAELPSRKVAEQAALAACRKQVSQGCTVVATSEGGVIVLVLADDGSRAAFAGATAALAVDTALDQCRQKGLRCTFVDSSENVPDARTTRTGHHKQPIPDLWGTFAYREDRFPNRVMKFWAVSAKPSQEEAVRSALELCQREEKAPCTAKAGIRNGFIAAYSYDFEQGTPFIESDVSDIILKRAIDLRCRQASTSFCVTHFIFDVRRPVQPAFDARLAPMVPSVVAPDVYRSPRSGN